MTDNGNYGERSHRTVNPLFLLGSDAPQEKTGTDVEGVEVGEFGNKKTTGKIRSTDWLIPSPAVNNVRTEGTDLKSEEGADPNITPPSTPPVPPKSHVVPPARKHRTINPLLIAGGEKPHNVETVEHVLKPTTPNVFRNLPDGRTKNVKENNRPRYETKLGENMSSEEWTEDETTDDSTTLGGERDTGVKKPNYAKALHLTKRDVILIRFMARYRYAYSDQLARLVDTSPKTITGRLRTLEQRGLVRKEHIADRRYLWTSRKGGNAIVDINFPEVRKGSISYATIAHTVGLASLGVELEREAGGKDLLGEGSEFEEWVPPKNRWKFGIWGHPEGKGYGEMTVTEREIRQAQMRWRGNRDSDVMRQIVHLAATGNEQPECEEGGEGLFVVYGNATGGGEHIPDLVIVRERKEDGKPRSIAIELELTEKTLPDWVRILRNYQQNGEMFEKIVYFTHKRSIRNGLMKADEQVGLGDRLVLRKYVPKNSNIPFWG